MKKYEKEVVQAELNSEKAVLKKLKQNYQEALDEINEKIEMLLARDDADMAHVIYQVQYQKALKAQIQGILENLHAKEFETVSEYLTQSYDEGFIGTLYALQAQGVPLAFPINQELVVAAVQHETMLTSSLYNELGLTIKTLQKEIAAEISRGVTNALGYSAIAMNIANRSKIPMNKAMTIARTESHRIRETAAYHVQAKAVEAGADVVKIWDASLDGKTRPHHRQLDGQIRELDEPFEVAGYEAMRPGGFGVAKEDINCRCRSRCEARWALDSNDTKMLGDVSKMDAKTKKEIAKKLGIPVNKLEQYSNQIVPINAKNYGDFKKRYKELWKQGNTERVRSSVQKINDSKVLENNDKSGTMFTGGRILNPDSKEGKAFAKMYYPEIRSFSTDCKNIANNLGKKEEEIESIKQYLFHNDSFEPDCAIAQSWQRLMIGDNIQKHDKTLIEHELYEMSIKKENPNISHSEAHAIATKKYDYQKEVDEYYGNLKENKKSE